MKCQICKQDISIKVKDFGDTQSEFDYEYGHENDCIYFETSDRTTADRKMEDFNLKKVLDSKPTKSERVRRVMYNDGTVMYQKY